MTVPCARASLLDILAHLDDQLAAGASAVTIAVLDPDLGLRRYAGERVEIAGVTYVHRPFRLWVDLAERRGLRLRTPRPGTSPLIELTFEPLDRAAELGAQVRASGDDRTEWYGAASPFARISKLEEPGFLLDMADALGRIALPPGARVLDLGVNTGDELALLLALVPALREGTLVGVDHSASALATCRDRFASVPGGAGTKVELHQADLGALGSLGLGRFDLVLSIGTLQSPGVDDRAVLRQLVQDHLTPRGAVILGFPNCRYIDGEIEHGTRMKNFRQPELGLLIKDIAFYRKYLQQHDRQVFVTGNQYLLVTAVATARGARAEQPRPGALRGVPRGAGAD